MIIEFLGSDLESRIIKLIGDFRDYESLIRGLLNHEDNWKWREKKFRRGERRSRHQNLEKERRRRQKMEEKSKAKSLEKIEPKKLQWLRYHIVSKNYSDIWLNK